ncbi:MAG: dihydropteroate synthase [Legionella sp.]|nr:dihydropteroate synthase [Legionella sp.]
MNANQFLTWLDQARPLVQPLINRALIMAIVNVTPDSFSDGGSFTSVEQTCDHILTLIELGADIIDIGGESTKPQAIPTPLELELTRVMPVIEQIRKYSDVCISIDTYKPQVMEQTVQAGATFINDVYALRCQGALEMASKLAVPVCIMHMKGNPQNMQINPQYISGIVPEVKQFFEERICACIKAGIPINRLILDPGFGFGKSVKDNLQIVNQIQSFKTFGAPILLGVSKKSTIGAVLNKNIDERVVGSIVLGVYAALEGVNILRTHNVEETKQALVMLDAVRQAG